MVDLRVLHIVQPYDGGGVSNVVASLMHEFRKSRVKQYMITAKCSQHYNRSTDLCIETPYLRLLKPNNSFIYGALISARIVGAVERLRKEGDVDVVLVQPGWYGMLALKVNKPLFVVVHGTYKNELRFAKYHPIEPRERLRYFYGIYLSHRNEMVTLKTLGSIRRNFHIIAVSRKTAEEVEVETGVRDIVSILNGVNRELFKPMSKDAARSHLEQKYGVNFRGYVIAHIGLSPRKGTYTLVKALVMLKKMGAEFTALFVGRIEPPSYRSYVEDIIRRNNLNVKLFKWVPDDDLPYIYNSADVTVVPSYSEGSPLVIPESLACGTPVIATNVGGNPEYLSMAGLSNNLIDVHKYDFHVELAEKLRLLLYKASENNVDSSNVPSWDEVARRYLDAFRKNV